MGRAGLLLAGLMCSLPFLNPWHYYPIATFYEEWFAFLLGVLAFLALLLGRRSEETFRVPQTSLWLCIFAAVLALQVPLRDFPYPQVVLIGTTYVLWAALVVVAGDMLRDELGLEATVRTLARFVLVAALVNSLLAIVQFFHLESPIALLLAKTVTTRATANLAQPNLLADLVVLGLSSAIYLRVTGQLRLIWFTAALILLLVGLSLTVSRAGSLLVAWIMVAAWWARRGMEREASRRLLRAALFAVCMFFVFQVLIFQFDLLETPQTPEATLIGRFYEHLGSFDVGESVYSVRFFLWQQAWKIFLAHPLLGIGWGQLPWGIFNQLDLSVGQEKLVHEAYAHNLVLQLLAETGIAGTIPVVVALGAWLWRQLSDGMNPERWWIVTLAGVEVVHSMIEFPLWYSPFLGVLALLVGLGERGWIAPRLQRVIPASAIAVVAVSSVILVRTWQDYSKLWPWLYISLGIRERQADLLQPYTKEVLEQLGKSLLVAYVDVPASGMIGLNRDNLQEKIAFHERVMRFSPTPDIVYRHVLLLAIAGRDVEAAALLGRAMRLYPEHIEGFVQIAETLSGPEAGAVSKVVRSAEARLAQIRSANKEGGMQ